MYEMVSVSVISAGIGLIGAVIALVSGNYDFGVIPLMAVLLVLAMWIGKGLGCMVISILDHMLEKINFYMRGHRPVIRTSNRMMD